MCSNPDCVAFLRGLVLAEFVFTTALLPGTDASLDISERLVHMDVSVNSSLHILSSSICSDLCTSYSPFNKCTDAHR